MPITGELLPPLPLTLLLPPHKNKDVNDNMEGDVAVVVEDMIYLIIVVVVVDFFLFCFGFVLRCFFFLLSWLFQRKQKSWSYNQCHC